MFSKLANLSYSSEDWTAMQTAHQMASAMLGRDPTRHENAERLARTVMNLFDHGMRDAKQIAMAAAKQEADATEIGASRNHIGS